MEEKGLITDYPLFLPSDALADKGRVNWTKKEAKEFFDWYISEIPRRIDFLTDYLRIEKVDLQKVNSNFIPKLDEKVLYKLKESKALTELNDKGVIMLTNEGYAFLVDVGSLFSHILLNEYPKLKFTIAQGKSHPYQNWPILSDSDKRSSCESFILGDINSFYRRRLNNVENNTLLEFYNGPLKSRFRFL
jgi:hypothetical protein